MPYGFSVDNLSRRSADGTLIGAAITVGCEKTDNGNVIGKSTLTWFATKADFPSWPPTKAQVRAYIVRHLRGSEPGSSITRAARMKQNTALIVDDPETWKAAERIISTTARYDR